MGIYNIGGPSYSLPVLDTSYPKDITMREQANGQATFEVKIAKDGFPSDYKYQWYVNNTIVNGATNISYTMTGLTKTSSYTLYCVVSSDAGKVTSKTANLTVTSALASYTLNGTSYTAVKDPHSNSGYDWLITLTGSTTLRFSDLGNCDGTIDVFLVGGGGGGGSFAGSSNYYGGGGGGGGYTKTFTMSASINTNYIAEIGGGGAGGSKANGGSGGTTSFNGTSIGGGSGGGTWCTGGNGGSGGGAGEKGDDKAGNGGSNGGNGGSTSVDGETKAGGTGQGSTTRGFGSSSYNLYAGGGGGGQGITSGSPGTAGTPGNRGDETSGGWYNGSKVSPLANRGGGGCGGGNNHGTGQNGGSGVILIRNHR